MTLILNSPETFAAESLAGFVAANATRVRPAPGGVVRSTVRAPGKVAVVVGGGSGHYPAFAGVVGEGLADGAVCGDVFASPSTRQVMDICRAVDQGAGVWLSFGNYAGDVLNFSAAATRLRAHGMRVALLAVTDDVASASPAERHRRRGVAGDLVVFKVAGAAAEAGYDLDAVEAVACPRQRPDPLVRGGVRRVHAARRGGSAVHPARGDHRLGPRRPRRAGCRGGPAALGRRAGRRAGRAGSSRTRRPTAGPGWPCSSTGSAR